jgi:hypothetical protein
MYQVQLGLASEEIQVAYDIADDPLRMSRAVRCEKYLHGDPLRILACDAVGIFLHNGAISAI